MQKLAQLSLLVLGVALTTGATPVASVAPLMRAPLAIIEAGTVSTVPKSAKARGGRVVVLRPRTDTPVAAARQGAARPKAANRLRDGVQEPKRSCACAGAPGGGGSASDVVELRNTESGLRVMIIGPDGQMRTRYVPAPPGSTARHGD